MPMEQESGSYTFSVGEFGRLCRHMIAAHNLYVKRVFEAAGCIVEDSSTVKPSKIPSWIDDNLVSYMHFAHRPFVSGIDWRTDIHLSQFLNIAVTGRLNKVKQVMLSNVVVKRMPAQGSFVLPMCNSLTFDIDRRQVKWDVDKGENAVQAARANPMACAFFLFLKTAKWMSGYGGVVMFSYLYSEDTGKLSTEYRDCYGCAEEQRQREFDDVVKLLQSETQAA